jgi:hypothetical protein
VRGDSERDGGKRPLVSDHRDEYAGQLRSDGIARGANREYRDGVNFGHAHGGGDFECDAKRNQQRRNGNGLPDAHDRRAGTANHEFGDIKRNNWKRPLVSDHGDECADQLRSDGIARWVKREYRDRIDLGHAHGGGNLHGDPERNQRRRYGLRDLDDNHQSGTASGHQRSDC